MVFTRWNGFGSLPWTFHAKLTFVVLLTIVIGYISWLELKAKMGDTTAMDKMKKAGGVAFLFGLVVIVFAVLTFN
jgi:hypothetical protein